jgi:prevent-host-death family protein
MKRIFATVAVSAFRREKFVRISVTQAKRQVAELVRRAEAGDEVILTRHGHGAVRLVPVLTVLDRKDRRTLLEEIRNRGSARATAGPDAAKSQDFLYGGDGLPGWSPSSA